ncbi:MAG: 4Fe-4S dicluster domain-containing protein [Clostridia bacterium]|nr:4Fe-4S dicluster domain-containing protein [Clostridia bacterium]
MPELEKRMREIARRLLEEGVVRCVIGWENTRDPEKTRPAFITKPEEAERLVFDARCVNGTAKYLLDERYAEGRIAVCVRGCDARAVQRLITDGQFPRERAYLIGLPCDGVQMDVCHSCAHRNPPIFDELAGEPVPERADGRFEAVEALEKLDDAARNAFWTAKFDACIRCYACRNACPACNCRECYADQYRTGWQGKQFNLAENRNYGLTRAFHVGDRCIECGQCELVCPMRLPLMLQTRKILKDINALFGAYECGLPDDRPNILGSFDLDDADDFR